MSMVAVFTIGCCKRELVRGRYCGNKEYPPSEEHCPFGCKDAKYPSGKPARHTLSFDRYESEEMIDRKLLETWEFRPGRPMRDVAAKR